MKTATLYGLRRLAPGRLASGGTLASSTADSPAEAAARFASSNVRPRPTILLWSRFHAIHWPACCVVDEAGSRGAADRIEVFLKASSMNVMELPPPSWPHMSDVKQPAVRCATHDVNPIRTAGAVSPSRAANLRAIGSAVAASDAGGGEVPSLAEWNSKAPRRRCFVPTHSTERAAARSQSALRDES
jgi:hypothetical protein